MTKSSRCDKMKIGGDVMALTREEKNKRSNECHKRSGYSAQYKYKAKLKECRFYITPKGKDIIQNLASSSNVSVSQLIISAIEEKYGIDLHEKS